MNINNLFSSLQPAVAKIQEQMQAFDKKFYKLPRQMLEFQKRFDSFPRKMLEFEKKMLSFSSLYDNEALIKLRRVKQELNIINERNAKLTMFMAQYKDLQNITQTFYGLQFSTTIKKNNQTETQTTQTFYHETTISQAEHTRILSERDYYKEKAFYWQAEFNKENKERLQLQCITQTYNSTQSFKKSLSIQNSNNAKKKEYTELKKWIVEIASANSNIQTIKTRNKKAREIEKIVKSNKQHYSNVIQAQISRVANLYDYIKEVLKKQV